MTNVLVKTSPKCTPSNVSHATILWLRLDSIKFLVYVVSVFRSEIPTFQQILWLPDDSITVLTKLKFYIISDEYEKIIIRLTPITHVSCSIDFHLEKRLVWLMHCNDYWIPTGKSTVNIYAFYLTEMPFFKNEPAID